VSHLRFGPQAIRAPYLVQQAGFVGCHHFGLLDRVDVLGDDPELPSGSFKHAHRYPLSSVPLGLRPAPYVVPASCPEARRASRVDRP
jgi:hypothetical protein